ncbi:Thioredoxin domain protein [Kalmanozyma brasiliensis GHG001]|uniref:Thioredoxin domain-containing protein n=1 Tax=Kalmanozyma brasiliensis (strain GHG001) TaxID=1365824 RepID=V5EXH8_KALBG|nr:Thioredoxin domain protein [Kalmanozyma brasiliensis GHG001]EST07169.1 Thioredoxin domain protein [Kalmanozyma brasiliensis GHG001]
MLPSPLRWACSLVLLSAALLTTTAEAALFAKNSKVTILDASNFKREVLDIEKPTMVAFTAPWCGHCKNLVPDYTRVAAQLDGVVKLASIDCDDEKNKPTCGKYGIQGFPTLKLFPSTKKRLPKDYQGPRSAKDIAAYMVDALPMGAKKLKPEELQEYAEGEAATPKVILFSKKATSSPLYKSLALDFRKSLSFAFLRGDQRPVQAAARIHLGVDVSEDKLPLLIVVPARSDDGEFDKASIKKYTGALKYHELNAWIKETVPEAKSGKVRKPSKKPQLKKPTVKIDEEIQEVPEGANREWRAEEDMTEEEKKKKMEELAEMLNTAIKQGKDLREAKAAAAEPESVQKKNEEAAASTETDTPSTGPNSDESSSYSSSSSTDADDTTSIDHSASYASSGDNPDSLKENLQRWLEGEQVDWSSEYSTQFSDAHKAAEKLMAEDPDKAEQMALESERWLAQYLVSDLDMMKIAREKGNQDPSLNDDKIERVEKMYNEILKRIEVREQKLKDKPSAGASQEDVPEEQAKAPHDEL